MVEEKARSHALAEQSRLARERERREKFTINEDRAARREEVASTKLMGRGSEAPTRMMKLLYQRRLGRIISLRHRRFPKADSGEIKRRILKATGSEHAVPLGFFADLTRSWSSSASTSSGPASKRKAVSASSTESTRRAGLLKIFRDEDTSREALAKKAMTSNMSGYEPPQDARSYRPYYQPPQSSRRRDPQRKDERRPLREVQITVTQRVVLEDGEIVEARDLEVTRSFYRY